jgi:hypothetical protein
MADHPFAAEAEIVKRATELPGAIAAGLSLFGGILRCGTCGREQPVGNVGPHLRSGWPKCCGLTMSWVTLKLLAAENWGPVPDGFELAAAASEDWRVETGKLCARKVHRTTCRKPSAAELNRPHTRLSPFKDGSFTVDAWWPYCLEHLYGNWIEQGKVMHWILRETRGQRS